MSTWITKRAKALGLKKLDAKAPLRLEVTAHDVKTSSKKDPTCCAFANATKRQYKVKAAYFFRSTAWLEYADGRLVRYLLPVSMQKEIVAFDRNKTMEPGVYEVKPPARSATMAAIKRRGAKRPGRHEPGKTGRKQKVRHATSNVRTLDMPASMAA